MVAHEIDPDRFFTLCLTKVDALLLKRPVGTTTKIGNAKQPYATIFR